MDSRHEQRLRRAFGHRRRRGRLDDERARTTLLMISIFGYTVAVITFLFAGCGSVRFSGARVPTEHTFRLTPTDVGFAEDASCRQDWVTGVGEEDVAEGRRRLDAIGVRIVRWNPFAAGTAGRRTLYLAADVDERDADAYARLLAHELVHYCDRAAIGDRFDPTYFHSAGRWTLEVRAFAQDARTLTIQGYSPSQVASWVDQKVVDLPDRYWLHDIDPTQRDYETRRILLGVLDEE